MSDDLKPSYYDLAVRMQTAEAEAERLRSVVEQLIGDQHAISADYTDSQAEVERLRAALGSRGVREEEDCLSVVRAELKQQDAYAVSTEPHAGLTTAREHQHTASVLRVILHLLELTAALRGVGTPQENQVAQQPHDELMERARYIREQLYEDGEIMAAEVVHHLMHALQEKRGPLGTPQEKEHVNETLAERNYVWVLEHQILPNVYGLKYVALLKAINILKSQQVPPGTPHQEEKAGTP